MSLIFHVMLEMNIVLGYKFLESINFLKKKNILSSISSNDYYIFENHLIYLNRNFKKSWYRIIRASVFPLWLRPSIPSLKIISTIPCFIMKWIKVTSIEKVPFFIWNLFFISWASTKSNKIEINKYYQQSLTQGPRVEIL